MTLDRLMMELDALCKHWRVQVENRPGQRRYSCTVYAKGKRFTVSRAAYEAAVRDALQRIRTGTDGRRAKGLKLVDFE